jgi:hypothetical protein
VPPQKPADRVSQVALYDPRGIEAIVTQVPDWKWMERASRKACGVSRGRRRRFE